MNWTQLLQERRMEKFSEVYGRWQGKELSCEEAGALLGVQERRFRRYCRKFENVGLDGLFDKHLGKQSAKRVPADQLAKPQATLNRP